MGVLNRTTDELNSNLLVLDKLLEGLSEEEVISLIELIKKINRKPGIVIVEGGEVFNAVDNNSAEGVNAHAEGFGNAANGEASHVEGIGNTADGAVAHVEGRGNTASGNTAHVEGKENKGSGDPCHAEGYQTEASGAASHTEGKLTKASGPYAHAEGEGTIAQNTAEHACGRYNVSGGGVTQWSVGIGTSDDDRKNAAEIRNDGKLYLLGLGGYDGKSAYGKKSVQETIMNNGVFYFNAGVLSTTGSDPTTSNDVKQYLNEVLSKEGLSDFRDGTYKTAVISTVFFDSTAIINIYKFNMSTTYYYIIAYIKTSMYISFSDLTSIIDIKKIVTE